MERELLMKLARYDFYSGSRESFYKKSRRYKAILVQGQHWEKPPEVTILLPTYKRCDLLKEALESALQQEDVRDYQIIVADNEGVSISAETETSLFMRDYVDSRVIYYRYDRQISWAMDAVAALAKSKWICFLHDDDVLAPNYLKIMLQIVNSDDRISYLSCNLGALKERISERNIREFSKVRKENYTVRKAIRQGYYFYEARANWLGAFIDRQHYVDIGGIPDLATGIGDHIMVGKYNDRYGVYRILDGPRLYFRRECGKGQLSFAGGDVWTDCYTSELFFYFFLARRNFPLLKKFFEYKGFSMIQKSSRLLQNGPYGALVDVEKIAGRCCVKKASEETKMRYCYLDLLLESVVAISERRRRFEVSVK